jgi:hypothetical protein
MSIAGRSPRRWQRRSNANTNGPAAPVLAEGTGFATVTEAESDAVADELSDGPRKRLAFAKPTEQIAGPLVAITARIRRSVCANVLATVADAITAATQGCALQIAPHLQSKGKLRPLLHPMQLRARSIEAGQRDEPAVARLARAADRLRSLRRLPTRNRQLMAACAFAGVIGILVAWPCR